AFEMDRHDKKVAEKAKPVEDSLQELQNRAAGLEAMDKEIAEMQMQLEKLKMEAVQTRERGEQEVRELLELQNELEDLMFNQEGQVPYRRLLNEAQDMAKVFMPAPVAEASRAAEVAMGRVQTEEEC
ncbi:hypothetical protein LPJ61_006366, partial [Coemansia biformis]